MKKILVVLLAVANVLCVLGQATQPCIVKQYNQKLPKTPLGGVEVTVSNAGSQVSADDGSFVLNFRTLKPGDKVNLVSARKTGFEVMNTDAVRQWFISRDKTIFELVMMNSEDFAMRKKNLTETATERYQAKYERAMRKFERLKAEGKLKEEEFNRRCDTLEFFYQNQLTNLDNYIDRFARIDLSEVSDEEQRILEMVEQGKIDKAVEAYEKLDISNKLRQAREARKTLLDAKERIETEVGHQDQAIDELMAKQKREIATLKLAGGRNNYQKVASILKENALADTTDAKAMIEYAYFSHTQKNYNEEKEFLLRSLRHENNPNRLGFLQNQTGALYFFLQDFNKAEEYYLMALESITHLSEQDPDANLPDMEMIMENLAVLYTELGEYPKAEEYYQKTLDICSQLPDQDSDQYKAGLARIQTNVGIFYQMIGDFKKAEDSYRKALENYSQVSNQDTEDFKDDMAAVLINFGGYYQLLHDFPNAEDCFQKALEFNTSLYEKNPEAFQAGLALSQLSLGGLYTVFGDYQKGEDYSLKALENYTQLFQQDPDAYRTYMAFVENNLGALYNLTGDNTKAENYWLKSISHYTHQFKRSPDAFRTELCETINSLVSLLTEQKDYDKALQTINAAIGNMPEEADFYDSKGELLLKMGYEQAALAMWQKVMELDPDFLSKHEGSTELYKQLKERGLLKKKAKKKK